jgi:hypothetical protein
MKNLRLIEGIAWASVCVLVWFLMYSLFDNAADAGAHPWSMTFFAFHAGWVWRGLVIVFEIRSAARDSVVNR